ncbi:MAG: DUF4340 domain-containing protein [Parvibaculaceae bacterium]
MRPRSVLLLAVAALVSVALAVWAYSANNRIVVSSADTGERLFPALVEKANDVAEVTLKGADGSFTVKAKDGKWTIASGYPASQEKITRIVVELARMVRVEPKTDNPAKYPLLEVDAPDKPDAKGRLLTVKDAKGATLAEVILGKTATGGIGGGKDAQYVRLPSEPASWLVEGRVDARAALDSFVDTSILSLDREAVAAARFIHPDGSVLELKKTGKTEDGQSKYEITGLPAGAKLKSESEASFAATDIAVLEFTDVRPGKDMATPAARAELEMEKGLKLGFGLTEDAGKAWVSVSVLSPGEDKAAADAITAKTKGWEFQVGDYKAKQFKKTLGDLTEAAPAPEPAKQPEASQTPAPETTAPQTPAPETTPAPQPAQ